MELKAINVAKFVLCYVLCAIYSSWAAFGLAIAYIFKRDSDLWVVKDRPVAPKPLTSNEFGEHKFMTVNVSSFDDLKSENLMVVFSGDKDSLR